MAEVQAILGDIIDVQSHPVDILEIQGTIEDIAKDKCRRAAEEVCASIDTSIIWLFTLVLITNNV